MLLICECAEVLVHKLRSCVHAGGGCTKASMNWALCKVPAHGKMSVCSPCHVYAKSLTPILKYHIVWQFHIDAACKVPGLFRNHAAAQGRKMPTQSWVHRACVGGSPTCHLHLAKLAETLCRPPYQFPTCPPPLFNFPDSPIAMTSQMSKFLFKEL